MMKSLSHPRYLQVCKNLPWLLWKTTKVFTRFQLWPNHAALRSTGAEHRQRFCSPVPQDSFLRGRNKPDVSLIAAATLFKSQVWVHVAATRTRVRKGESAYNQPAKSEGWEDYCGTGPHVFYFHRDLEWNMLPQNEDSSVQILTVPNHFWPIECCSP